MPKQYVFGVFYRMFLYHYEYPIAYIAIPCFWYAVLASVFSNRFKKSTPNRQLLFTLIIVGLTILLSSPLGGMLWHYHDMSAGYFPENWIAKMISKGSLMGLEFGFIIVALSAPYNLFGLVISYYLMRWGAKLFENHKSDNSIDFSD